MIDSRNMNDLHPIVQVLAQELIQRMAANGYPVLLTSTYRDNEMQSKLYAQGRTAPGSIVTNAKAGYSAHNYRIAFDICKNVKGHEYDDEKFFDTAGRIGEEIGLEWGGNWTSLKDRPHFQVMLGYSVSDYANGVAVPKVVKSGCGDKRIVKFVQRLLGVEADGSFGSKTKEAAQKHNPSGEIDAATLKSLLYPKDKNEPNAGAPVISDVKYNLFDEREIFVPSIVVNNTTYSGVKVLLEELGFNVSWDAATATRVIKKPGYLY